MVRYTGTYLVGLPPGDRNGVRPGRTRASGAPKAGTPPSPAMLRLREIVRKVMESTKNAFRRRTVTVDADQGFLRVVAFIGRQVVAWGTAPLGSDAESDGVSEAGGDAGRLRWLLQELPFKNGRLVTALPTNAPLVRHLRLPKMRRRYVTQVILSEIADTIPFDMEEVERSWVQRRTDAGHEAMAVVVPKEAVDGHVKLLREAGRPPAATYARASALASGVGVQDAVMIDLGTVSVDIVLVREGSPRVTHRGVRWTPKFGQVAKRESRS